MSHVLTDLGRLLVETGRAGEAVPLLERALKIRSARFDEQSQLVQDVRLYLGAALSEQGDTAGAEPLLAGALAARERAKGFKNLRMQEAQLYLARHRHRTGRAAEAQALFEEAMTGINEAGRPADHWLRRVAVTIANDLQAREPA